MCPLVRVLLVISCLFAAACGSGSADSVTPAEASGPPPLPVLTKQTPPPILRKIETAYMKAMRACAHAVIVKDKRAAGVYTIEFQVAKDGKTTALGISGRNRDVRNCVERNVNTWTFSPIADGSHAGTFNVRTKFSAPKSADHKADARMIKVINEKYMVGVHECHREAMRTDPKAVGRVQLRFVVNVDGGITIANVMGIPNAQLLACIRGKVLTWKLPAPLDADGKPTTKSAGITILLRDKQKSKPSTKQPTKP